MFHRIIFILLIVSSSSRNFYRCTGCFQSNQLFQFNGSLYEQIDGVAMGSPLGPLMANTFMCSIEEKLENEDKLPSFYKRYVDDTLAAVKDISTATTFLATLNEAHPAISFTMEVANNNKLRFIGMELTKIRKRLETCVYRKTKNKGLLLHYQSHVDACYKRSLLMTMLNRAHCLSSPPDIFAEECDNLRGIFLKLKYPEKLINSTITRFIESRNQQQVGLFCHSRIKDQPTLYVDSCPILERK